MDQLKHFIKNVERETKQSEKREGLIHETLESAEYERKEHKLMNKKKK